MSEKYYFDEEVFSKKGFKFKPKQDEELIGSVLRLKKSGKVLDLGCGEAGNSFALAEKGFEVTCIDISKTAIDYIKKESKKRKLKIKAICADLEEYEFNEKYDVILGTGIFHFIPEKDSLRILNKIKEITNSNGLNIIEVLLNGDISKEHDSEGYYFKKGELKEFYSKWKIEQYKEYEANDKDAGVNNKLARVVAVKK
jgi:cyclopropane fatty-acyl-phospholipid synthase-like methyltransferase